MDTARPHCRPTRDRPTLFKISIVTGLTKRRRADRPDDGSVGQPVVGGVVRPVIQDLTERDGPDDGSVRVVKSLSLMVKHIGYNIIQSSFVPVFWDGRTDREMIMLWNYGCSATLRPTDIGRRAGRRSPALTRRLDRPSSRRLLVGPIVTVDATATI